MASIQKKGEGWYCTFSHAGRRHTFALGKVDEAEAQAVAARVDYSLMRLKQGLLSLDDGAEVVSFVRHGGRPPGAKAAPPPSVTLQKFRESYLETFGQGAIEANTLDTVKIHLAHLASTLGEKFPMAELSLPHLQRHVDCRRKAVAGVTIKKERLMIPEWWTVLAGHLPG